MACAAATFDRARLIEFRFVGLELYRFRLRLSNAEVMKLHSGDWAEKALKIKINCGNERFEVENCTDFSLFDERSRRRAGPGSRASPYHAQLGF